MWQRLSSTGTYCTCKKQQISSGKQNALRALQSKSCRVHKVSYSDRVKPFMRRPAYNSSCGNAHPAKFWSNNSTAAFSISSSYSCHYFTNLLPMTAIMLLYLISIPIVVYRVDAAPIPLAETCGAHVIVVENATHRILLHGVERSRALCELRGNLTKQIVSLRRFMGPRNFSKVWSKHSNSYAFLKIANGRNITLRTWHKQLQVYAATADRLYERARNYKAQHQNTWISSQEHLNKTDGDLRRLKHLIIITRSILCDLELTANLLSKRHHQLKSTTIERTRTGTLTIDAKAMHTKIELKSDKRNAEEAVDPVDINMLFQRLRRTLLQMRKPLKHHCLVRRRNRARQTEVSKSKNYERSVFSDINKRQRQQENSSKIVKQRRGGQ